MENLRLVVQKLLIKNGIEQFEFVVEGDAEWEAVSEENGIRGIASGAKSAIVSLLDGKKLHLFIKCCEEGTISSFLNEGLGIFERESFFYSEVFPAMLEFEKSEKDFKVSDKSLQSLCFKCFGCETVNNNSYIVLEKFLPSDYYITKAEQFHTIPQIMYWMKSIALYHATSFCMKKRNKFQWDKHSLVADKLFHPSNQNICDQHMSPYFVKHLKLLRAVKEEIHKRNKLVENCILSFETLCTSILERLEKLEPHLRQILSNSLSCPEELCVLTHGDFHMWNVAFSNKGQMEAKFFDFQLIRFTSGLIDVHHYLSQVSTPATRNKHLHSFLKAYHDSFKETCRAFGLEEEASAYSMETINKEYEMRSPWGFFFGFLFILPRFVSKDFYDLLDEKQESSEIIELLSEKGSANVWGVLDMYVDMMQIQDDIGTIELMEKLAYSSS